MGLFIVCVGLAGCDGASEESARSNDHPNTGNHQQTNELPDGVQMDRVTLAGGISIEVPTTWRVLSKNESDAIVEWSNAALVSSNDGEVTLFRANSTPLSTYASVAITATEPDPDMPIWALEAVINENPGEMDEIMSEELRSMLPAINQRLSAYRGVRTLRLDGNAAFVVEYDRTGIEGDVRVQLLRVQRGNVEYAINLGYRLSESHQWEAIMSYMLKSINFQ